MVAHAMHRHHGPALRAHAAFTPFFLLLVAFGIFGIASMFPFSPAPVAPPSYIAAALVTTFVRLMAAYVLAVICAIPLAILATRGALMEKIFLPVFDILQSVPTLAFFPLVIALFLQHGFANGAAVFILFLNMLWNIVFSLIAGIGAVPHEIFSAARVFNMRGGFFVRRVLLPAILPALVTGSLFAWAEGWNVVIVAEVLHTYIPGGTSASDLFGIGSVLANAPASGSGATFVAAILGLVGLIAVLNFAVWQRLLHYAETYRFE